MANSSCSTRGFKALMATQFLGALNDNVYRFVVVLGIADAFLKKDGGTFQVSLTEAVFLIPFIFFSPLAGWLADKHSKSKIIIWTKVLELLVMSISFWFFISGNLTGLVIMLVFMGFQSTIFSPCKYGIIPEIVDAKDLSRANGYLEFWTFLAIILGSVLGGILKSVSGNTYLIPACGVVALALLGLFTSFFIQKTAQHSENVKLNLNPLAEVLGVLKEVRVQRNLFLAILASAYFWFVGVVFKVNAIFYAKEILTLNDLQIAGMFVALSLGIGFGSIFAGKVSEGKVELGLVPIGIFGLCVFSILQSAIDSSFYYALFATACLGFSGGIYIVPLNSFVQRESPPDKRGKFIAANNFITFSAMFIACFVPWFLIEFFGVAENTIFLVLGILSFVVGIAVMKQMPEMFVRCANWLLTHSIYRIKVYGAENIPAKGGALIVCNHASYMDPPLILATLGRPVRFLMWRPLYEKPFVHFFSALTGAIPIAEEDKPKDLLKSIIQAREAIKNGDLVCIFPEGGITRIGHLIGFNRGLEKIVKGLDVPIIPAFLDRVWGSIFSYENGKFFWKWPKEFPYRLSMHYGEHLLAETPAFRVRIAVQELSAKAAECRSFYQRVLHFAFIKEVKRRPFRTCVVDSNGQRKSFIRVLAEALALSKIFKRDFAEDNNVGILLPPSSAGMLCNLGLLFAGKVPVNLNYTLSKEILNQSIAVAGIKNVISVKEFSDRFEFSDNVKVCDIKNLAKEAKSAKYLATLAGAMLLPISSFKRWFKIKGEPKDLATIIFSSGSTGKPKGVMLTHQNISANIEGLFDLFQFKKDDALMGVLPFFHSFGFTVTLWMPLLSGFKAIYHNNPIDSKTVGKLVEEEKATILLSTPTFLSAYTKRCTPEQFRSLKRVIVGAEKLKTEIREAFETKFKLIPLEGYGATELSPVASINIDNYEGAQGYQVGNKPGSVGHPLPGIAAKVVHPETFAELEESEEGLLLIKGANLMRGYLDDAKRTAEVIKDGWYVTGDIAKIDREGFIVITDRMARFSKIGGEMVPHIKIEEELQRLLGGDEQNFVVTAIPDEKKGEQLIVFYNLEGEPIDFVKKLSGSGLPNLWVPKQENFIKIETFPLLGSGKLDLRNLKERAEAKV